MNSWPATGTSLPEEQEKAFSSYAAGLGLS